MSGPTRASVLVARLRSPVPGQPTSQQRILTELRRVILAGDAPPGTAIPLEQVATLFDVSVIPVRESLKTLVGEGLVDHEPRGGYRVARLTPGELREFYVIREALEAAALRAAVRRATSDDDAAATAAHEALGRALRTEDFRTYHRDSRAFHMALLAPSGMGRLIHVYELAWNVTEPAQPMSHVDAAGRAELHADHEAMLDAFCSRDAEALVARSGAHYQRLEQAAETPGVDRY